MNTKQVVKVICHKAASPPHTDDSVVFASRWTFSKTHLFNAAGTLADSVELLESVGVILFRRLADYQDKT